MIPPKYIFFVSVFLMSIFMTFLMSLIITSLNLGFIDGFIGKWLNAYVKAFIVAYPVVLIVLPVTGKIIKSIKIRPAYKPYAFALVMDILMTLLQTSLITFINIGFSSAYHQKWLTAAPVAFIVGYPVIIIVKPLVDKLTQTMVAAPGRVS